MNTVRYRFAKAALAILLSISQSALAESPIPLCKKKNNSLTKKVIDEEFLFSRDMALKPTPTLSLRDAGNYKSITATKELWALPIEQKSKTTTPLAASIIDTNRIQLQEDKSLNWKLKDFTTHTTPTQTDLDTIIKWPSSPPSYNNALKNKITEIKNAEPSKKRRGDNEMTSPGIPTGRGGLNNTTPNTLVAIRTEEDGSKCIDTAHPSDWIRDPNKGQKINIAYETTGFRETGFLFTSKKKERKAEAYCSFVMISPRYALTAAHCVAVDLRVAGSPLTPNPELTKIVRAAIPRQGEATESSIIDCLTESNTIYSSCGYDIGQITGLPIIYPGAKWVASNSAPGSTPTASPDLAIIEIKFKTKDELQWANVAKNNKVGLAITITGFGVTDKGSKVLSRPLVGYRIIGNEYLESETVLYWKNDIKKGSTICFGDSGGAVFGQVYNGSKKEGRKELTALISGGDGLYDNAERDKECNSGRAGQAQLVSTYFKWICENTNGEAGDCR